MHVHQDHMRILNTASIDTLTARNAPLTLKQAAHLAKQTMRCHILAEHHA